MRYYLVEQEKKELQTPVLRDWFKRITGGNKRSPDVEGLKKRELFCVDAGKNTVYPPMLLFPFVMLEKEWKECLNLYEPNMEFREIILLDQKRKETHSYFRPVLEKIDCLAESSVYSFGHAELSKIVLEESKIPDKVLFGIKGSQTDYYVMRLDALESFLRRGLYGIRIKELAVHQKG
jgi:hypothetical protein